VIMKLASGEVCFDLGAVLLQWITGLTTLGWSPICMGGSCSFVCEFVYAYMSVCLCSYICVCSCVHA